MRLSWRLFRFQSLIAQLARASLTHTSQSHSLLHSRSLHGNFSLSLPICLHFDSPKNPRSHIITRTFSSQPEVGISDSDLAAVSEIFSEPRESEEIKKRFGDHNLEVSYKWVVMVLQKIETLPEIARRFFDWLSVTEDNKFMTSRLYNLMLMSLGVNGSVDEFWGLVELTNKKGFGVSKPVVDRALERFAKEGLIGDVEKLKNPRIQIIRRTSSEPEVEISDSDFAAVSEIFSETKESEEIRKRLEALDLVLSEQWVLLVLEKLESSPEVAKRFFDWLANNEEKKFLCSRSYNFMLMSLAGYGAVGEFWGFLEKMKKGGFGVSKLVRDIALERFTKKGLVECVEKLKHLYDLGSERFTKEGLVEDGEKSKRLNDSGSNDRLDRKMATWARKIIIKEVWTDKVEKKLRESKMNFSSDTVTYVIRGLESEPTKALIFFRWVEESDLVKHEENTYNALANVLGVKDSVDRFWKVVDEMKSSEFEISTKTLKSVLKRFLKNKMIGDAVNLYELAMAYSNNKPSNYCTYLLLKRISSAEDLDMNLLSKVLRLFTENGNALTDSELYGIMKSLRTVKRFGEVAKVLKAMEECGYVASSEICVKIVSMLCKAEKKKEAIEFANSGEPNKKVLKSLTDGLSSAGDFESASRILKQMGDLESAVSALESVVKLACQSKKAKEGYKILREMVAEKKVKPLRKTYQRLIHNLLAQGSFKEASSVLRMMRAHTYPLFVGPFIEYVTKTGTEEEASAFLDVISKEYLKAGWYLRVFKDFFEAGRVVEAQSFLSNCSEIVRNDPDVLALFASKGSGLVVSPLDP